LHHELTGRENAYLTGALLGLRRRDMRDRIDAIADFAGIGDFFDAPLRTYSAGMMVASPSPQRPASTPTSFSSTKRCPSAMRCSNASQARVSTDFAAPA
jgi:hypothetical protein